MLVVFSSDALFVFEATSAACPPPPKKNNRPIAKPVLSAVRESCRGIPVNVEALSSALDKLGYDAAQDIAAGGTVLAGPPRLIPMISSGVLHPRFKSPVVAVLDCLKVRNITVLCTLIVARACQRW